MHIPALSSARKRTNGSTEQLKHTASKAEQVQEAESNASVLIHNKRRGRNECSTNMSWRALAASLLIMTVGVLQRPHSLSFFARKRPH
ncbi:hypothetical protein BKA69DRAFT_682881 [Paraphysoderma sedebokerense]|nr:hypothetical protein BKA69DRAFT_682881 [Paraphysoderma sedebokerense]